MGNELATRDKDQALAALPEHLRNRVGDMSGMEGVGKDDLLIPRLCVAQSTSPQLNKASENFIRELRQGDIFNSVTSKIYGEKVVVVPLFFFRNFIKFIPMDDGGGVAAMYENIGQVPPEELAWKDGKPPSTTEFKNRMCLVFDGEGAQDLAVVSFKSTGMKHAKQWNSMIQLLRLPAYARSYTLTSKQKTKGSQSWYVLVPTPGEFVPHEFFVKAEEYFHSLRDGGYKVDTSGIDETEFKPSEDVDG